MASLALKNNIFMYGNMAYILLRNNVEPGYVFHNLFLVMQVPAAHFSGYVRNLVCFLFIAKSVAKLWLLLLPQVDRPESLLWARRCTALVARGLVACIPIYFKSCGQSYHKIQKDNLYVNQTYEAVQ